MKQIRSRDNPQFRTLLKLARSAKERHDSGMMLLDGDHLIEAARTAGVPVSLLAISESALQRKDRAAIFERVAAGVRLVLADQLLDVVSSVSTASGLVAVAPIPKEIDFPQTSSSTCLMLEAVQDPGNLGTMLRTAAAAGIRHVAVSAGSVSAWSPKVLRAGMGAHFHLNIVERADLAALLERYKGTSVATQPHADANLYDTDLTGPVAWLFGSEGVGLSTELVRRASVTVRIPMPGRTESLNVASALAICLFEQLRQQPVRP